MNIVISPSNKKDKKYEARIDGKKSIHFGAKITKTLRYTKTLREKNDI